MSQSSQANTQPDRSGLRNRRTNTRNASRRNVPEIYPQEQPGHHMNDIRPRRERTRQDDYLYYSLSGPPAPPPRYDQHQTYYDEGYLDVNPWMRQEDDGPNFTLARNFPRIVRWKGDDRSVKADEKGEREMAPQVEAAEELGEAVENGDEDYGRLFLNCSSVPVEACANVFRSRFCRRSRHCRGRRGNEAPSEESPARRSCHCQTSY